jgi:hypothetical protein
VQLLMFTGGRLIMLINWAAGKNAPVHAAAACAFTFFLLTAPQQVLSTVAHAEIDAELTFKPLSSTALTNNIQ